MKALAALLCVGLTGCAGVQRANLFHGEVYVSPNHYQVLKLDRHIYTLTVPLDDDMRIIRKPKH